MTPAGGDRGPEKPRNLPEGLKDKSRAVVSYKRDFGGVGWEEEMKETTRNRRGRVVSRPLNVAGL